MSKAYLQYTSLFVFFHASVQTIAKAIIIVFGMGGKAFTENSDQIQLQGVTESWMPVPK